MNNVHTDQRARRYLPSEPLNKHPTSPTLPVAKLRLLTDLFGNRDLRKSTRPQSVSPTPWRTNSDRPAMSLPGTPIRSNGYYSPSLDRPVNLYRGSVPKMSTTSNLLALSPPSLPSLPSYFSHHDRYGSSGYLTGHNTAAYPSSSSSHRNNQYNNPNYYSNNSVNQSYYNQHPEYASQSDYGQHHKYPPTHSYSTDPAFRRSNYSSGYHHHKSGLPEQYLRSRSYVIANQNSSLRDAIKNELKHYADDRKRNTNSDLVPLDPLFSSTPTASSSYINRYPNYRHRYPTSSSLYRSHHPHGYDMAIHGHAPHHHRSESDLNALLDLHSDPPDPWLEKSPPPGVPIVQGVPQMYLNRNASYPSSIDSLSMHPYYEHSYPKPSSPFRYAQSSSYLNRYKYRY